MSDQRRHHAQTRSGYPMTMVPAASPRRDIAMALAITGSPLLTPESKQQLQVLREVAANQGLTLDPLFVAEQGGLFHGAVLAIQSPGKSAMMHLSGAIEQPHATLVDLLHAATQALFADQTLLVQGLVHPGDHELPQAYRAAGFRYLTDLIYMDAAADSGNSIQVVPEGLVLATYESSRESEFLRGLETTYIDSLDCPGLTGLRSTSDVLAGHRATGVFDPKGWFVLMRGSAPVAVLLTARVARASALEIVYVGVAPNERGQGVGRYLLGIAHERARELALSVVTLALDATNEPARRLYERWGYRATQRRRVWIATPTESKSSD